MKIISSALFVLYFALLCIGIFVMHGIVKAEDLTTSNLTSSMGDMTASGGTSVGTGYGCSQGKYCTSGTTEGGGTYTSTFDVPLTEAELNQGFTINSGVTINSHSSNSTLQSCANGLLQSGDCRDVFKLTITLKDDGTTVETFVHSEELTWSGLKDFTYADAVGTNSYGVLTGIFELYGIDAGYPTGYYGPQFSDPSLTIDYQTALVTEDTTTLITDVIQTATETTIMDAATGGTGVPPVSITTVATTIPVFQTYTSAASTTPVDTPSTSAPVVTAPVDTTPPTETTMSTPVVETAVAAPTIAPVAQQTETQQAEETQAEAQIETAMAPQPVAAETTETAVVEPSETTEPAPATKTVAKAKPQKAKAQRKTASSATASVAPVAVPVTPAVAAQAVVDNIAPSQKYGNNAQTITLVAMGMIANNRGLFKASALPDTAKFFKDSSVPDGPSMVDRMTNYQVFGQSNGLHNALVESQWRR